MGDPDGVALGKEPTFIHWAPQAVESLEGKQWGGIRYQRVREKVPLESMAGTVCTLRVCEKKPVTVRFHVCVGKPAFPITSVA